MNAISRIVHRAGWASRCRALAAVVVVLLGGQTLADDRGASTGRMIGTVTVVGTGEPVAGARIRALIGKDEKCAGIRYAHADAVTDANGRYTLELPMGHATSFGITLPAGYWSSYPTIGDSVESFATTPEAPEHTKNYRVQPGPIWRVRIDAAEETAPFLVDVLVNGRQLVETRYVTVQTAPDESGLALLALPESGGEFEVWLSDWHMRFHAERPAKLAIEPGFRPERVVRAEPHGKTGILTFEDDAGRKATLSDAQGAVVDGQAELRFRASAPSAEESFAVSGRVVDENGEPLADAVVTLCRLGATTLIHGRTDRAGRFTISNVSRSLFQHGFPDHPEQVHLCVTRDGFAGRDTQPKPLPEKLGEEPLDFGTISLARGHEIRLKVLGPDGKPVLGAWVEPDRDFAARVQFARTDAQGRCTLRNLALGIHSATVRFGRMNASTRLIVTSDDAGEVVARLGLPPAPPPADDRQPLAIGEKVPEWELVGWTDGVERKLSDYRGQVVVIDVWGTWCTPCMYMAPALMDLKQRFQDRDVEFLGIHTAGTGIDEVRDVMKRLKWAWPSGLDAGENIHGGATVQHYRVTRFPTTLVVGRDGKIAFSDASDQELFNAAMKEVEETAAAELGIPFPIPEGISRDDYNTLRLRMFVHMLSKQVEAALRGE